MEFRDAILMQEQSSPSNPPVGFVALFAKSDHSVWYRDSNGLEHPVSSVVDTLVQPSSGLTTSVTAYVAGDQLGGEITFTSAVLAAGRGALIHGATLMDKAKVVGAVDLYIFNAASTPAGDNSPEAWTDANMLKLLGVISFETPKASANNSWARGVAGLPVAIKPAAGTSIFGVLVTRVGHTFFGAVDDLQITLDVEQF